MDVTNLYMEPAFKFNSESLKNELAGYEINAMNDGAGSNYAYNLGIYATEARALEVLDEIQFKLQNTTFRYRKEIDEDIYYNQQYVFEMPKE